MSLSEHREENERTGCAKKRTSPPDLRGAAMADGGEKKKGSTRGGGSQRKVSKSGKRYFKNPWIDEKPSANGYGD